jgi:hypothetical protein
VGGGLRYTRFSRLSGDVALDANDDVADLHGAPDKTAAGKAGGALRIFRGDGRTRERDGCRLREFDVTDCYDVTRFQQFAAPAEFASFTSAKTPIFIGYGVNHECEILKSCSAHLRKYGRIVLRISGSLASWLMTI